MTLYGLLLSASKIVLNGRPAIRPFVCLAGRSSPLASPHTKPTVFLVSITLARHASRNYRPPTGQQSAKNKDVLIYTTAGVIVMFALCYAAVPLYQIYCQASGLGGTAVKDAKAEQRIVRMQKVPDRLITVTFSAERLSAMAWNFKPTQSQIRVSPGETALAFFTARNPTDKPIDGVATYNVVPYEAGQYLNKIQCFCFEEQRLNPNETVDLPVFFYIDPEYARDPRLANCDDIVLSYTFFPASKGMQFPGFTTSPKFAVS